MRLSLRLVAITVAFLFASISHGWATADGPDTWEIVAPQPVPLRANAAADASVLRLIAPKTRGVKNLGCRGRPSFEAWMAMSDLEREVARGQVWCRVAFAGTDGWVRGTYVGEPSGKLPAYDCSRAEGPIEELICRDADLAVLDHRLTEAYWSAMSAVIDRDFANMRAFRDDQRTWIAARNGCGTSADPRLCVQKSYIERIRFLDGKLRP